VSLHCTVVCIVLQSFCFVSHTLPTISALCLVIINVLTSATGEMYAHCYVLTNTDVNKKPQSIIVPNLR